MVLGSGTLVNGVPMRPNPHCIQEISIPATLRDKTLSLPTFKFLKEQLKLEMVKRIRAGSFSSARFVSYAFKAGFLLNLDQPSNWKWGERLLGFPTAYQSADATSRNLIAY